MDRRRTHVFTAAAIATSALVTAGALSAAPAGAGSPGHWSKLSSGDLVNTDEATVHRYGKDLQVVWSESGPSDPKDRLRTRIIGPNGAVKTANLPVLNAWQGFNHTVALLTVAGQRFMVLTGLRSTNASDDYRSGAVYYATSADGHTWTLRTGSISHSTTAYATSGLGAVNDGGTVEVAFTAGSQNHVTLHKGVSGSNPAPGGDETSADTGTYAYDVNLGKDLKTGKVWTVWYSNSGLANKEGVNAQPIFPSHGSRVHGPQSYIHVNNANSSIAPDQPLSAVPRPSARGGGVWTAYDIGYPSPHKIGIWRLGAGSLAFSFHVGYTVGHVGVGAAPGGRLWIFWTDRYGVRIHAARTNPAVTRIGAIRTMNPSGGTDQTVWSLSGDGANGPLDLVAVSGSPNIQVFHTQFDPGLSARVSPGHVDPGDSFTVTVTDAGVAVKGATVHWGSKSKTTNSAGHVTFSVPGGADAGKEKVTATKSGFYRGIARFRIT
jgi:hypothetical protein